MSKRSLIIALAVLLIAAVVVQAQDDPPLTDPTVQAAVSTLLAQTQTAAEQQATSMAATQNVGAALSAALTATAQAQTMPTPTPVVFDVSGLQVAATTPIDIPSGPGGSGSFLAPDGEHFAYLHRDSFCLYAGNVQQDCIDLEGSSARAEREAPRWSPDSRYVAFTEDFFRMFVNSDIWVWDTVEHTLTDITDDGKDKISVGDSDIGNIDQLPHWLPDGRILFLRYQRVDGDFTAPDIYAINPDGSGLEQLGTLTSPDTLAIYQIDVSADRIAFIYLPARQSPLSGVWISDLNGDNPRKIMKADPTEGLLPASIDLSPDGRYVLVTLSANYSIRYEPERSIARVIDVESGELMLIDPDHFVGSAGWSPQGSALAYTVLNVEQDDASGLYITGTPGEAGELLLQGDFAPTTSRWQQSIGWGGNNDVLLARRSENDTLLVHLE